MISIDRAPTAPVAAIGAVVCLASLLLAACDDRRPSKASRSLADVTLSLGDQAKGMRAKAEAAKILDGALYKIAWANFQGAAPLFEALRAGAVDTAPAGDTPVLFAAATGAPLKIVAASRASGRGVAIIVPANSPIRSVADLKGRDVIVSSARGSVSHHQLIGALHEIGLEAGDVKIGFMLPIDALAAFRAGHLTAWATFGSYLALAEKDGGRILRDGTGINSGLAFVTASDAALADPLKRAALSDLLRRLSRADEWADRNPREYEKTFADVTGLPPDVVRVVLERDRRVLGPIDESVIDGLQQIADLFARERILPRTVNARAIFDTEIFVDDASKKRAPDRIRRGAREDDE